MDRSCLGKLELAIWISQTHRHRESRLTKIPIIRLSSIRSQIVPVIAIHPPWIFVGIHILIKQVENDHYDLRADQYSGEKEMMGAMI